MDNCKKWKKDGFPELIFQQIENYVRPVWPDAKDKQSQMMYLDFHVENMEEGVRHALACGAALSPVQTEDGWRVLLDPAGHPFCILPKINSIQNTGTAVHIFFREVGENGAKNGAEAKFKKGVYPN